jgi:hypothetical protein
LQSNARVKGSLLGLAFDELIARGMSRARFLKALAGIKSGEVEPVL